MATKKRPAKKAVKKTAKKTTRKRVTKQEAVKQDPDVVIDAQQAFIGDKMTPNQNGYGYAEAQSNASVLQEIEVIDLRGIGIKERFSIMLMLDSEGYIDSSTDSLLTMTNLMVALQTDTLILQHTNKLVRPAFWEEANGSNQISKPTVQLSANIGFSLPSSAHPFSMEIDGAQYVRVS